MWSVDDIDALYRRHAYAVNRRCRDLLSDVGEAEDVTHEVFLRVLRKPDAFRGASSPATFLYAVATNLCLNRLRDARARGPAWQEAVAGASPVSGNPERTHLARDELDRLLAQVDEQTALIALYHFHDGLSQGEIAELVGLSRITVNKRIAALRARAVSGGSG
jgi:RNA polymerase sigma-70 factor (ECF subfamily)